MKLQAAIDEVKRVTRVDDEAGQGDRWTGWDFTNQQDAHDPTPVDDAIATILNAVVGGALVPAPAVPDDVAGLIDRLSAWRPAYLREYPNTVLEDAARVVAALEAQAALEAYGREKVREGMKRAVELYPQGIAAILAAMEKEGGE